MGPEAEEGQKCHVNLRLMFEGEYVVNWHVYYEQEDKTWWATVDEATAPIISTSANRIAGRLVEDVENRLRAGGVGDDPSTAAEIAAMWATLPSSLTEALRELLQYQ